MLSFSTLLLRSYYNEIGWNEDNLYANINRSSSGECSVLGPGVATVTDDLSYSYPVSRHFVKAERKAHPLHSATLQSLRHSRCRYQKRQRIYFTLPMRWMRYHSSMEELAILRVRYR